MVAAGAVFTKFLIQYVLQKNGTTSFRAAERAWRVSSHGSLTAHSSSGAGEGEPGKKQSDSHVNHLEASTVLTTREGTQGQSRAPKRTLEGGGERTSVTTVTLAKAESLQVLLAFAGRKVRSDPPPTPSLPTSQRIT